jgi:hypothetical protein
MAYIKADKHEPLGIYDFDGMIYSLFTCNQMLTEENGMSKRFILKV